MSGSAAGREKPHRPAARDEGPARQTQQVAPTGPAPAVPAAAPEVTR
ncbi:hypothetical protein [Streptomyces longispororuber]|nr:hypothetical protein [Streptomyces longispororuber]MCQ4212949.1 hypothetical protein [Streptomyces longispororuber]